ncbi:MAG: phage major capsid protein [Lachnospiraceae bacterium]|nr:phage major capsid protein [Lachnospiraceae bacterium]
MHIKKLKEQRAKLMAETKKLLEQAEAEERAMNEDEVKKFGDYEKQIKAIDATIEAEERARGFLEEEDRTDAGSDEGDKSKEEQEKAEERAFESFIRGVVEERADVTMAKGENGAIIPTTIANKIIEKTKEICPIFADSEHYTVAGTLSLPYYDESSGAITMTYATEGVDGSSTSGKFKSIELKEYLARAITDISKSLINNSKFDIVNYVIRKMAEAIALFLEHELLIGTSGKIEGLSGVTQIVEAASETAITADELIDLQESVPDRYQANAYWIMNKDTRKHIRKLKDGQGNYLLQKDATAKWGYTLFGKDVRISDAMPKMAAGARAIFYGDYKGLAVKISEDIDIEVLRETKARLHLLEVLGFVELDAKVQNAEMIAALDMKSAS